jgi:dolichol-phosphate mannosyltransferase
MKISVVCPTFNEVDNIPKLVTEIRKALQGMEYEIIIADDDSPDRTWECAKGIANDDPRVRVLRRQHNRGLGWSVIEGFGIAKGEAVACMDADLQHDPAILPLMLARLHNGADVVVGSRYVPGGCTGEWRLGRRAESWLATRLAQWFTGVKLHDPMSGYFLMRRTDFLQIRNKLDGHGFKILLEIASKMPQARIVEVPLTFRKRLSGISKLSRRVVFEYFLQLSRLRGTKL